VEKVSKGAGEMNSGKPYNQKNWRLMPLYKIENERGKQNETCYMPMGA